MDKTDIRDCMRDKLASIIDDEKIVRRIERGIYNFALEKADKNRILKKYLMSYKIVDFWKVPLMLIKMGI